MSTPLKLNVSGKIFLIPADTIKNFPESYLGILISGKFYTTTIDNAYYVSACPSIFKYVFRYIVHGVKINIEHLCKKYGYTAEEIQNLVGYWSYGDQIFHVKEDIITINNQPICDNTIHISKMYC